MRFSFLLVLFITSTFTIFSQSKLDSLVAVGNEQSFQFNFEQATQTFETVIKLFPESSLGYYYISRNSLWFYLANKDSISENSFLKYFEIAKSKGELEYEDSEEDAVLNFNLGNIYLLKSIYSSVEQNTMDAFWATKSAVNYFEDAIDYDNKYSEAYLPLGTIKYAIGFVPGFLGWAISVAGLEGEKREGLANILKAYENCANCKTEAAYHLGKLYTEYNAMYDSAEVLLSKIVIDYPNNELFLYQYAILQIDRKELDKAEVILNKILHCQDPKFSLTYALSMFLKGEVFFKQNKFEEAIIEYERFIEKTTTPDYTGIANYKIALSYEMLDEKLLAQKHYILARNGNHNIAEDLFAYQMGKELYDKKFSDSDKTIIVAKNHFESGKYFEVLEVLKSIDIQNISFEQNFDANILKIDSYQNLNKFEKSALIISHYNENSDISELKQFVNFIYLSANQKYMESQFSESETLLDLAFDDIDATNIKLNRLLVNLSTKLDGNDK